MADKKAKRPQFTSPKGTFKYPRLNEADTKFKDEGEFSVKLVLSKDDAEPLIAKLKPLHDEAVTKGKAAFKELKPDVKAKLAKKGIKNAVINAFYSDEVDAEGNETGNVEFNIKRTASGVNKKTNKPWEIKSIPMFDAKGKKIAVNPWGGTVGKVTFTVGDYFIAGTAACGIKLSLEAVQILELVQGGEKSASGYGFEEEEGYEGSEGGDEAGEEPAGEDGGDAGDASDF